MISNALFHEEAQPSININMPRQKIKRFSLVDKLGEGMYDEVWTDRENSNPQNRLPSRQKATSNEASTCKQFTGIEGIPKLGNTGKHKNEHPIATELLGCSLHD